MNQLQPEILNQLIFESTKENPQLVSSIIDSATLGVKEFSDEQRSVSSKLAFILIDLLDNNKNLNFGHFSKKEVLEHIKPYFDGCKGWIKYQEILDEKIS